MGLTRRCSKTGCPRPAVATLTYAYADRAVVVGPLATYAEPHTYDLCLDHAERLTVPRGWDVVRLEGDYSEPALAADDLLALADAVREGGRARDAHPSVRPTVPDHDPDHHGPGEPSESGRRAHLRILRTSDD